MNRKYLFFIFITLSSFYEVKAECYSNFVVTPSSLTPDAPYDADNNNNVVLRCKISERNELEALYTVSWTKAMNNTPNTDEDDDNTATNYMNFDLSTSFIDVSLNKSIQGVIDYGQGATRETELEITYYFYFNDGTVCSLLLTHDIEDENTKEPRFQDSSYSLLIREDYPIYYPVPNFETLAVDFDVIPPNIDFNISTDENCPLDVVGEQFESPEGEWINVVFQLNQQLDYDTLEAPYQYECIVSLTDFGIPTYTNMSIITLTVEGYSDEEPSLNDIIYEGRIDQSTEGTQVDIIPEIMATDADIPQDILTYSISDLNSEVDGTDYFYINETTGNVYIKKDIDNAEFLSYQKIYFSVAAFDGTFYSQSSILSIILISDGSNFEFDKLTYSAERMNPPQDDLLLRVHATGAEDIVYSFDPPDSTGSGNFSLDNMTGEIKTREDVTPSGSYWLDVVANSGNISANTLVNIFIQNVDEDALYVINSLLEGTIEEEKEPGETDIVVFAEGATLYCIEAAQPQEYEDKFEISSSGVISTTEILDADNKTLGNEVSLRVAAYLWPTTCKQGDMSAELLRNEALVQILITDTNDNRPHFIDINGIWAANLTATFPVDKTLQRAAGSVITVKAIDADSSSTVSYSIENGGDGVNFKVDSETGNVYYTSMDKLVCEPYCFFTVTALDEGNLADHVILTVLSLEMSQIYTLMMYNMDLEDVDMKLNEVSMEIGVTLHQLYSTILPSEERYNHWDLEVQISASYGDQVLSLNELNEHLSENNYVEAVVFTEEDDFTQTVVVTPPNDVTGYQVAVGILGSIVGIVILVSIAFVCLRRSKGRTKKQKVAEVNEGFTKSENDETFASIFIDNYSTVGSIKGDARKQSTVSQLFSSFVGSSRKASVEGIRESPLTDKKDFVPERNSSINSDSLPKIHDSSKRDSSMETSESPSHSLKGDSAEISEAVAEIHNVELTVANANEVPGIASTSQIEILPNYGGDSISGAKNDNLIDLPKSVLNTSRRGSILKDDANISLDEPKSVAFKVLVDTAEFEVENPEKEEEEWEQLKL